MIASPKEKLSDFIAKNRPAPDGTPNYIVWDSKVVGFGLRIGATSRVWILYYRNRAGKQRKMRLGAFPSVGAENARKIAQSAIGKVAAGNDPAETRAEERRQEKSKVGLLLDSYLAERGARGLIAAKQEDRRLRAGFGEKMLNTDIATIDRKQAAQLLSTIAVKRGPGASGYFRKVARTFFDWCLDRGFTQSNPLAGYRLPKRTKAEKLSADESGRALPPNELAAIWNAAGDSTVFGRLVRFIMLTGCRRDEGASLEWRWIDRKASTITLPAQLTKMGRDHIIPISAAMGRLLDKCPKTASRFVFPSGRVGRTKRLRPGEEKLAVKISGWSKLLPKVVAASGVNFTIHDFRRSIKTQVRELGFDADIAGILVGHARDSFEARYDKSQLLGLRAKAATAYADMIEGEVAKLAGKVVAFPPAAVNE
ncbi:MAG TPA: integrase arm-type DNA-binding domain-containing protein [Aestuariivirga sp.]|nr:integrase arm-type DNA-binding domain-containing protein [Aestuariivirga sp.]